ncbi:hypothetical protein BDR06DRAFT_715856 [Suillus hirtellus]|nr:hypothetical protein BDR06DRAFT_715856 [Suillus hirtellus]
MSDSVAFILDSRYGLGTVFYFTCSLCPSIFMLLNMLGEHWICIFILSSGCNVRSAVTFLPGGSYTVWSNVANM